MVTDHKPSWWQTIPGALTGAAAFLTAVTGLLLALNQMGMLPRTRVEQAAIVDRVDEKGGAPGTHSKTEPVSSRPNGMRTLVAATSAVTLATTTYTLLNVETIERTPETTGLRIGVRALNRGPYAMNFWTASFRLLVDDLPRAPVNDLNKVVQANSADEGVVEFTFPRQARTLALQIHMHQDTAVIALNPAGN